MPSLLTTKIETPLPPQQSLPRPRILNTLEREITHYKLILVSAPAGYGKTTLLAQWARASHFPIAWLSLDEEDNDVERFFRYLLAMWQTVQPKIVESQLGVLLGAMSPDNDAVLTAFTNAAHDTPDHTIFVLDDYHLINDPTIHEALTFLLDHLPPTVHFVLSSRNEPPLPLARYRARQALLEFGTADLGFLPEETELFLNERMGLGLTQETLGMLQGQLEGWVAGLQLMALTLKRGLTAVDRLIVSGRHRFIADYLSEEIVAQLPEDMQQFLLQTSILDRLCGSLCQAVTGTEETQKMLTTLEGENLFLIPLDDRREWFRYHHLFADFLHEELKRLHPDIVTSLHQRAARWYLAHDLPEQAFHHGVAGDDVELVLQLLERHVQPMLMSGEFKSLKQWLDLLPEAWHKEFPIIDLFQTGLLLFTGQLNAGTRRLEAVEQRLTSTKREDTRWQLARVSAVRCSIACFQDDLARAETFADQAFQDLPDSDHFFRSIIYGSLGDTYRRQGRWQEAKACYMEMLDFIHMPAHRLQSAHVFGALADLDLRQGKLKDAAGYWRKALAIIQERENWGRLPLPLIGWVHIRLAELLYEWNELAEAWDHLTAGLARAELGGDVRAMIAGYLIAGRLKLTEGDFEAAIEYLEQARPLVEEAHFAHWISRFERLQLELWLAQDRLRTAVNWCDQMLQDSELEGRPESVVAQLAVARVLIVRGDERSLTQALTFLEQVGPAAAEEGRTGIHIEALALQAIACERRGKAAAAMTNLEHALRLAEPEGYVRRFADLGLPMARLLQEARSRQVMPGYIERLLAAFGGDVKLPRPAQQLLPEPLTDREEEILELLAAGLTNPEIAEKLIISAGTVKKHASNIYGKLGVSGRTEAAARARELDLLD